MKNKGNSSFAGYIFEYRFKSRQFSAHLSVGIWYRLPATVTVSYVAKEGGANP